MLKERSLTNIKKQYEKTLKQLYHLEDLTNYDIKELSKCIDILQKVDIENKYKKFNEVEK